MWGPQPYATVPRNPPHLPTPFKDILFFLLIHLFYPKRGEKAEFVSASVRAFICLRQKAPACFALPRRVLPRGPDPGSPQNDICCVFLREPRGWRQNWELGLWKQTSRHCQEGTTTLEEGLPRNAWCSPCRDSQWGLGAPARLVPGASVYMWLSVFSKVVLGR